LALFWIGISLALLGLDGYLGWSAFRQISSQNYPTTDGVVTHSEVEQRAGGKHVEYSPNVQYRYAVAGKTFTGHRYRFGEVYALEGLAHQIVAGHPVGKHVPVYYNPGNPADALLRPGLDGGDLFLAAFLLPLNLVLFVIWAMMAGKLWRDKSKAPAGGAMTWNDGFQVRVRLSTVRPWIVAAIVAGLLAFAAIFVALGFGAPHPPMVMMVIAWCVILAGGLLGDIGCRWRLAQGGSDLVIDTTTRQITLPRMMGREMELAIPMGAITSIEVQRVERRSGRGASLSFYVLTFAFTDPSGSPCRERLLEWADQARTEALAAWLRELLRIEPSREVVG